MGYTYCLVQKLLEPVGSFHSGYLAGNTILSRDVQIWMCCKKQYAPISLQAIWTADNGNLPPWKGDLHHYLNTELSYWPGYTGNHLDLTASFNNWLWKVKPENERWTKQYFGTDGLNVPGVTTISGKPMGGWIQYSMNPATAAWLAQHFYWQWKYSMDKKFLEQRCRPYFDAVEKYLSKILITETTGKQYRLPLSSSPEYNDSSIQAWFPNITNYDLSLIKNLNREYSDILSEVPYGNPKKIFEKSKLYPPLDTNKTGLTIAPSQNLDQSHRHHAHPMAVYPMELPDVTNGTDKSIMDKSLRWVKKKELENAVAILLAGQPACMPKQKTVILQQKCSGYLPVILFLPIGFI
jgi:alpha-L-fucosidase 2